jgi:predicted nucleic acid-binding protein
MKPVLVDTSVWRKYLSGIAAARRLGELLDDEGAVLVHPFVLGEMVLGGLSTQEESLLKHLPRADVVPHDEVLAFVRGRRLMRRGLGWVDAHLLASALTSAAALWSLDARLSAAAADLGVSFALSDRAGARHAAGRGLGSIA